MDQAHARTVICVEISARQERSFIELIGLCEGHVNLCHYRLHRRGRNSAHLSPDEVEYVTDCACYLKTYPHSVRWQTFDYQVLL